MIFEFINTLYGFMIGITIGISIGMVIKNKHKPWSEMSPIEKRNKKIIIGIGFSIFFIGLFLCIWLLFYWIIINQDFFNFSYEKLLNPW